MRHQAIAVYDLRQYDSTCRGLSMPTLAPQLVSQVAFSRHRPLTRSVRRFGPVEGDFHAIQLGNAPHP